MKNHRITTVSDFAEQIRNKDQTKDTYVVFCDIVTNKCRIFYVNMNIKMNEC